MKLDILFFAAHPDDVEVVAGGVILKHIQDGKKVGIVDLTCGELGTRGNPQQRLEEAQKAAHILGLHYRENLKLRDCFFEVSEGNILKVVSLIRELKPEIVIANPRTDRHPDHARASQLVKEAVFMSKLSKIGTKNQDNLPQNAWEVPNLYYYVQDTYLEPNVFIDITPFFEKKEKAYRAYRSQFYDPENEEPETIISSPSFFERVRARNIEWGRRIGVEYAEGLLKEKPIGIESLFDIT
jgi:bacillithiol biosynthesis deacetylase BshB1